jgi:Ulp1 family protease
VSDSASASLGTMNLYILISFFSTVPYQDNGWDCGVFVCRYGFAMYQLRDKKFSYREVMEGKTPFSALITNSTEFNFDMNDIDRI